MKSLKVNKSGDVRPVYIQGLPQFKNTLQVFGYVRERSNSIDIKIKKNWQSPAHKVAGF